MKSNTGTVCYPFPYSAVDGCLFVEKANKNGTTTKKLCNFLPYLKCDINVDDGVEQTRTFRIAGVHESGRLLPADENISYSGCSRKRTIAARDRGHRKGVRQNGLGTRTLGSRMHY